MSLRSGLSIIPECLRILRWNPELLLVLGHMPWCLTVHCSGWCIACFRSSNTHGQCSVQFWSPYVWFLMYSEALHNNQWCTLYMCGDTVHQLGPDAHIAQMWLTPSSDLDTKMPTMMKVNWVLQPIVVALTFWQILGIYHPSHFRSLGAV